MANDRFDPQMSSDKIWRGDDMERCITDDLDALESQASALETGKAASNHTHTPASIGAAAADHSHSGYAASGHSHTPASIGAAAASHTHDYAASDHTHSGYAASGHSHTPASIGAAAASHTHDYAASDHAHADYFPKAGGDITGEVNLAYGLLRLKSVQTLFHSGTQLVFGSNNLPTRIGGSAITATKTIQVDSDERLKENIAPVDAEACRKLIEGIDVKTFNYIGQTDPCMGVIAQELLPADLAKFFVSTGPEGYLSVKEAGMVWPLLVVVQQLCREIAELKAGK